MDSSGVKTYPAARDEMIDNHYPNINRLLVAVGEGPLGILLAMTICNAIT